MKEKEKNLELFHQDPDRVVERNEEPQPKSVPMPLAKQGARRNAMDTAMDMAETISNSGGPSCSSADPEIVECTDTDYFLSSVPMANFWCISPVPREPVALNDYRWNLLMQGIGPENLVVHKCRNLSQGIPLEPGQRETIIVNYDFCGVFKICLSYFNQENQSFG